MPDQPQPFVSVVVPAFHEESNILVLYEELRSVFDTLDMRWEILFIDDGSMDDTWQAIRKIHDRDERVKGYRLSRNFGHQHAIVAGLSYARGQAVITMDADLQHPPETIPLLLDEWRNGAKVVNTIRIDSDIPWNKKITSRLFYKVFSFLSGVELSEGMADFRLLDRQVVDELIGLKEGALFLRGLIEWLGYRSAKVPYVCGHRRFGKTKYGFGKMLALAWTGVTSFSLIPLRLGIVLGLLTSLIAVYQLAEALYTKSFTDNAVPGWASTIGIVSLLFAVLFVFLGIIGEYIGRILAQVQNRPRFVVSDRLEQGDPSSTSQWTAADPRE